MASFTGSSITGISSLYVCDMPNINGLVLKLDASGISAKDGDALTVWKDVSGNGYHATPVTGSPIYKTNILNGKPIVRFTASNVDGMRSIFPVSSKYTLFSVARMRDTSSPGRIIASIYPEKANYLAGWWNGYEGTFYAEGWVKSATITVTTDWHQYTTKGDGTTSSFYEAGTLLASNNSGVYSPNGGIALSGYATNSGTEMSNCDIAEVILYDRVLDDTERVLIENYLLNKYGTSVGDPIPIDPPIEEL